MILTEKYDTKKKEGLQEIKTKYNERAKLVKIDIVKLKDVLGGAINTGGTGSAPENKDKEEAKYGLDAVEEYDGEHRGSSGRVKREL